MQPTSRGQAPHQPADPWQGGSLTGDVVVETANQRSACLSLMPRWESDMATPKQSEPSLSLDRSQLLMTAAALTAAGTVPSAEAAGGHEFWPSSHRRRNRKHRRPRLGMFAPGPLGKLRKLPQRNIIRAEAGLPLLSIPKELRRMKQVTDAMAFEEFADRHRQAVWEEVLAPVRAARGEPNWRPTRLMEGLAFQAQVGKILRERFKVAQHHRTRVNRLGTLGAIASFIGYDEAPMAARTWHVRTLSKR